MKKYVLLFALAVLCFSGCNAGIKDEPSAGHYFTYTPIIEVLPDYDTENENFPNQSTVSVNGFTTFVSEEGGIFSLFAVSSEYPDKAISGPVSSDEIVFSAFDGEYFVWSSEEGLFFGKAKGEATFIDDYCGKFTVLAENFVVWPSAEEICLYRFDAGYTGKYDGFSAPELVYADENTAIFKDGGEYVSFCIERVEEPDYMKDTDNTAPSTVAVDGYLYYCFFEGSGAAPEDEQICGKINSVYDNISTCPRKNDQTNDFYFFGSEYAFVDGELLLRGRQKDIWYKCEKSWALDEMQIGS